jgi:hypothetical protein
MLFLIIFNKWHLYCLNSACNLRQTKLAFLAATDTQKYALELAQDVPGSSQRNRGNGSSMTAAND